MLKYKPGDRIRILGCDNNTNHPHIGRIVTMSAINQTDDTDRDYIWCEEVGFHYAENEVELAKDAIINEFYS